MSSGLTIYEETHSRVTLTPAEIYLWSKKPSIVLSLPVAENQQFTLSQNPFISKYGSEAFPKTN